MYRSASSMLSAMAASLAWTSMQNMWDCTRASRLKRARILLTAQTCPDNNDISFFAREECFIWLLNLHLICGGCFGCCWHEYRFGEVISTMLVGSGRYGWLVALLGMYICVADCWDWLSSISLRMFDCTYMSSNWLSKKDCQSLGCQYKWYGPLL